MVGKRLAALKWAPCTKPIESALSELRKDELQRLSHRFTVRSTPLRWRQFPCRNSNRPLVMPDEEIIRVLFRYWPIEPDDFKSDASWTTRGLSTERIFGYSQAALHCRQQHCQKRLHGRRLRLNMAFDYAELAGDARPDWAHYPPRIVTDGREHESRRARTALCQALALTEALAREGKLATGQRDGQSFFFERSLQTCRRIKQARGKAAGRKTAVRCTSNCCHLFKQNRSLPRIAHRVTVTPLPRLPLAISHRPRHSPFWYRSVLDRTDKPSGTGPIH